MTSTTNKCFIYREFLYKSKMIRILVGFFFIVVLTSLAAMTIEVSYEGHYSLREKLENPPMQRHPLSKRELPKKSSGKEASLPILSRRQKGKRMIRGTAKVNFNPPDDSYQRKLKRLRRRSNEGPFGKRPFGPLSKFQSYPDHGSAWIGYFFEESLAAVLKTPDDIMIDCTVLELREEKEQVLALETFGGLMELVPLSLPNMVRLIGLCGDLPKNKIVTNSSQEYLKFHGVGRNSRKVDAPQPFSAFVLPGTLWCGMKDKAERYENLGEQEDLDTCCRAHDHCPIKLGAFENRYGVSNNGLGTRSHCLCEDEFFRCLKRVKNQMADMIGRFYFDILKLECLDVPHEEIFRSEYTGGNSSPSPIRSLYECQVYDRNHKCRFWSKRDIHYGYKTTTFRQMY